MSALQAAPNNFQSTIGPACWDSYQRALKDGDIKPSPVQFRNWALYNDTCSAVATSGASALAAAMLDPIFAAQMTSCPTSLQVPNRSLSCQEGSSGAIHAAIATAAQNLLAGGQRQR